MFLLTTDGGCSVILLLRLSPVPIPRVLQAAPPEMDTNAVSGHLPALQRQDDYADLHCANGMDFSLE